MHAQKELDTRGLNCPLPILKAKKALTDYGKWYGPYPYPRLTLVDAPDAGEGAGGMEYPTLVTVGVMDMLSAGSEAMKSGLDRSLEVVAVHEIAHQWWQSMVATNEAAEPWLDEGFADYSTVRLMNAEYGLYSSAFKLEDFEAGYLDMRRSEYVMSPGVPMYGIVFQPCTSS